MAVSPILVNAGSMNNMGNQNSAFSLMGKALNDMEARRNTRNENARAASDRLISKAGEAATRDIIGATQKNTVLDDFQNRFDTEYNSIYDENGIVRKGQEDKAANWSNGGFGDSMDQTEQDNLMRLSRGVDDAGRYSGDIYDRMLRAGLSPAQAEAQRKTQLSKWKTPEMTKGALQNQKIKSDQILKERELFNKNAIELFKEKRSTGGYTDAAGNFVSTKSGDKNRFKDALKTKADFSKAFGFDPTSDIGGNMGGDKAFGVYTSFLNQGYSPAQMREAISNTSAEEFFGTDAEANASTKKGYAKVVQNYLDKGGMKAGAKPGDSSGSGKYGSGSYNGIKDKVGFQKYLNQGNKDFDSRTNALLNSGKPGKQAVLDSIFNWYDEPKAKEEKKSGKKEDSVFTDGRTVKEILKSPYAKKDSIVDSSKVERSQEDLLKNKDKDDAAFAKMQTESKAIKDERKKVKEQKILKDTAHTMGNENKREDGRNPMPYKVQAQKDLYKTSDSVADLTDSKLQEIVDDQTGAYGNSGGTKASKLAQAELDSRDDIGNKPWWNQNWSIAGKGRDTKTSQNTASGSMTAGTSGGKKEILPSINSGSESQNVTNARNNVAVQQFNQQQDARILQNSPAAQKQTAITQIVGGAGSQYEKLSRLRDLGLSTAEAQQVLSQGKILQ